jgi:hypothetical protein
MALILAAADRIYPITRNVIRNVRRGYRIGMRHSGQPMDVYRAAEKHDIGIMRLDSLQDIDGWKEWLAADSRITPADHASFRIDFAEWLDTLTPRYRQVATLLWEEHTPAGVSRILGIDKSMITRIRHRLEANWEAYQIQVTVESFC